MIVEQAKTHKGCSAEWKRRSILWNND